MTNRLLLTVALLGAELAAVSRAAAAQPDPYRVEQLAPDVYGVIRKVPTTRISDANVLFIINDRDVVVVDANIYPASSREVIREIRKRTTKPVRYLINTHWHSDHHYGNREYLKAYPGVEIIGHPYTRKMIIEDDIPDLKKNLATEYPAAIADFQKMLSTGKRPDGTAISEAGLKSLPERIALYKFFVQDAKSLQLAPPTILVSDSLVIHRGERTIVIKWLGRGNTPGDLIVYLPRERVVATGDLVVAPVPFAMGSELDAWPNTLRELKKLDVAKIMPGHGNVMSEWGYVDRLIGTFESIWEQTRRAVAAGLDLEATKKSIDMEPFRAAFAGSDANVRRSFDLVFGTPVIEGAFKQLRPDSTKKQ